ncbi:MAG: PEGA domain-containing protein [Patescibacteria group bacterium]|jgi:hypothetical protein
MEYPGAKFRRPIRLTMLILFITAFFIISPLVILYSAGYRFDFKNGLLKETGSLSVDILPKTAAVYLEGLKIDQTLPVRLNNITPHKYTILLSAPGYYDFEKQIEINKNQTTYIKELVLIKKDKPKLVSKDLALVTALSVSGKSLAYIIKEKNNYVVKISDEQTGSVTTVLKIADDEIPNLSWSPTGEFLAVHSKFSPYKQFFVVNVSAIAPKVSDLALINKSIIDKYIWSQDVEPKLHFESGGNIYSFLPRLNNASRIASSSFQDWYLDEGSLWTIDYITTSKQLAIYSDTLGFKSFFASISENNEYASSSLKKLKLESAKKNTVVLADSETGKFLIVKRDKYFTVNADKMFYSKFNNWLILWNSFELWTYSENDEPYLLNRSGEKLNDIIPLDQYNTLGLLWNNEISALYPYFYTERSIVNDKISSMTANPDQRIIYYSNSNGIWKINY